MVIAACRKNADEETCKSVYRTADRNRMRVSRQSWASTSDAVICIAALVSRPTLPLKLITEVVSLL